MAGDHTVQHGWPERLAAWCQHASHVLEPILYSIFLAIWVNALSGALDTDPGYWRAIWSLGPLNALVVLTLTSIVLMEIIRAKREERVRRAARSEILRSERSRHRALVSVLDNANAVISRALDVGCNARYFPAVELDGVTQLIQARDLHIETVHMPSEYGFSSVPVDDPAFVSCRSYMTRAPIFEELPVDHTDTLYSAEVATMVEARQRWVLACPVLSIDGATGDLRHSKRSHGVLVFYGMEVPDGAGVDARIRESLAYAQTAAEGFSFVIEMGDAAGALAR